VTGDKRGEITASGINRAQNRRWARGGASRNSGIVSWQRVRGLDNIAYIVRSANVRKA